MISGYLITLLLIGEHERTGRVQLRQFWYRRARRLLPALFTTLIVLTAYTAIFRRDALGQLRGDVIAGLAYVSNWYQIWVGQGYTASGDFAPLRHLWSLAVEEQFYLLWPLAMIAILRLGARRVQNVSWALVAAAVAIAGVVAALVPPGPAGHVRAGPGGVVAGRRAVHLEDGLPVPVDADAGRRPAARRGPGDGLAAGGPDARADATARPVARRGRHRRLRRPRRADVVPPRRHPGRCRSVAVPRRVPGHGPGDARRDRRRHAPGHGGRAGARQRRVGVDRTPQLRPVPVPLADLPGHPRASPATP